MDLGPGNQRLGEHEVFYDQAIGLERVMGIEPTSKAWEAFVLPLNYTRA